MSHLLFCLIFLFINTATSSTIDESFDFENKTDNLTSILLETRLNRIRLRNDVVNADLLMTNFKLPCKKFSCRFGYCENLIIDDRLNHTCHCVKGVSGPKCDILDSEKLPCSSNPCYAGAKCFNYKDDYFCDCPSGREGKNCNKSSINAVDPCNSNPCGFNGVCFATTNGHWCFCNNGKQGKNCLSMEDQPMSTQFCNENTCLNGGRCLAMNNSVLCSCKNNYFGPKCEYLSNNFKTKESCLNNVCKNSGTCVVRNNKVECICKAFYTGKYCESSVYKQCGTGICNSLHGVCIMDSCYCFKGYKGFQCQTKVET